jgi:hypothetical protein
VGQARWQDDGVLEELQHHTVQEIGDPEGILTDCCAMRLTFCGVR